MHSGCPSQAAEFPRRAMAKVFADLNMPVTYIEDLSLLTPENLSHFDIFVNSGSVDLITPEEEKAVYDFVQNGGGFLGLHNASAGPAGG
jgi:type 1 glutamine amidotransferase